MIRLKVKGCDMYRNAIYIQLEFMKNIPLGGKKEYAMQLTHSIRKVVYMLADDPQGETNCSTQWIKTTCYTQLVNITVCPVKQFCGAPWPLCMAYIIVA